MKKQIGAIDFSDIKRAIVSVKGQNVLIDSDVASIYGVETREVNQAIKNNPDKFPAGYIVEVDKGELIKIFDRFNNLKHSTAQTKAFTEKGLYMLATILRSPKATAATIAIIETFAKLRELSHTIAKLADTKEKPERQSLMQKSGDIFSELIATDMPVSGTETTLEINFAVMKFKHTVKREKKKGTVQGAKKSGEG
ncbi:ORF6N domain-containing protein [Treponema sp. R6D11]